MIQWKELQSDIKIQDLDQSIKGLDFVSVLAIYSNLLQGYRIYATRSCIMKIISHVQSNQNEMGGLLLGKVYQHNIKINDPYSPLVVITTPIPSIDYRSSGVSLKMSTEIWRRFDERLSSSRTSEILVGWYHSHPHIGAFFSYTDRKTQKAFFYNNYSIGLVIDPFVVNPSKATFKIFCGPDSEEYKYPLIIIDHDFEMMKTNKGKYRYWPFPL